MCGDACSDGARAQIDLQKMLSRLGESRFAFLKHQRIGTKLLAKCHRYSVLELCTPHLQDILEFVCLGRKRLAQDNHRAKQGIDFELKRELDCCRINIVCALSGVHMLVRMKMLILTTLITEDFEREIRYHLVCIRVGRGSRTPWMTSTTKCSCSFPSRISSQQIVVDACALRLSHGRLPVCG